MKGVSHVKFVPYICKIPRVSERTLLKRYLIQTSDQSVTKTGYPGALSCFESLFRWHTRISRICLGNQSYIIKSPRGGGNVHTSRRLTTKKQQNWIRYCTQYSSTVREQIPWNVHRCSGFARHGRVWGRGKAGLPPAAPTPNTAVHVTGTVHQVTLRFRDTL